MQGGAADLLRLRVHPNQTTRVLLNLKLRSRWRSRFRYFFQLFPDAGLADFRVVNAVADRLPLDSIEQLEIAGNWLVRLSRLSVQPVTDAEWKLICKMGGL